uniref:Thiolase N-terminal domain-containing protein n=1 Tax=Aegilops tauschii subsp. strangulata TaxID=200361 RepID=A0A453KBH8_AEGTS
MVEYQTLYVCCCLLACSLQLSCLWLIQLGINNAVVAGGMETMSNAPKYAATARFLLA